MGKKVSLIIRAYNRLEYTIETLSNIIELTTYDNYEIIIVNNNSNDGTTQWIEWVMENSEYYSNKIKHIKVDENLGDWYGMVEGLKHVSDDSYYIAQVDNDVTVSDSEWLTKMVYVLENTESKITMLKRKNIVNERYQLKPLKPIKNLIYKNEKIVIGEVQRPVCCYLLTTENFKKFTIKYGGIKGSESKYKLAREFGLTAKLLEVTCYTHINRGKYSHKNKNVREFI